MEWLPGKNAALSAVLRHRRGDRRPAADLPVPGQRPGRGRAGQAARARDDRRPPDPADGAGRVLRRHRQARAAARRARQHRGDGPGQAAGHPRRDLAADARRRDAPRPRAGGAAGRRVVRRLHPARRRLAVRDQGRPDPRRAARARARRPAGEARVNLVLAILRASQVWGGQSPAVPGLRAALGLKEGAEATGAVDEIERQARALVQRHGGRRLGPTPRRRACTTTPRCSRCCGSPPPRWCRGWGARPTSSTRCCTPSTAASSRPGRRALPCAAWSTCCRPVATSTPSTRARCPRAWRGRPAWRWPTRWCSATSRTPATTPSRSGSACGAPARCAPPATTSPRCSRCSACGPSWDEASRRVSDLHVVPLEELGRPRIDVTVRISGFFRDAFPHVVAMLDDAVQLVAALEEPLDQNYVRAHAQADLAEHGDERRATTRIFGSKPGSYGAGILQVVESGNWRNDQDLAEVYTAWGGFAYGRGLDGAPAADDMRANYRRIKVAAKNIDTREHDIADSRRLLPVPRRHGRHRARADRLGPEGLRRRLDHAGRRPHPHAAGGDQPRLPGARGQPAVDQRDAAARLQGRLRARRDRRLPLRLRRHRRRRARLDVRHASPRSTSSTRPTRPSCGSRTPGRCAASWRSCTRPSTAACGPTPTPTWSPRMQQVYLDLEGDLEDRRVTVAERRPRPGGSASSASARATRSRSRLEAVAAMRSGRLLRGLRQVRGPTGGMPDPLVDARERLLDRAPRRARR